MASSLLKAWTGPLPQEELFPSDRTPNPLLHWVLHPLKRHLARHYLKFLQRVCGLKVIAVGGSNGKTTTRNLLYTLLSSTFPTVSTYDSITSTYNIPTSVFKLRPWTRFFICEMSVEYVGDMDFYLWLAKPHLAIITLIETEHTEYLGSIENVAREENKLTQGKWIKIINGNSPLINNQSINTFTFGLSNKFNCFIKSTTINSDLSTSINLNLSNQDLQITLPSLGLHLGHPVAAALLTIERLGLNPQKYLGQLSKFTPAPHRLNITKTQSNLLIIDDSYNSNPSSAENSLLTVSQAADITKKKLVVVVSQMNELGQYETSAHQKLAVQISKLKPLHTLSIGPAAKNIGTHFETYDTLLKHLKSLKLDQKHILLIKSSRSWKLDRLVTDLN